MTKLRFDLIARVLLLPLLIGAFAIPNAGCARRARRGVQRVVASRMNCPAAALTSIPQGNRRWRVTGCGQEAVFHCFRAPYVGFRCTAEMGPQPIGGGSSGGQVQVAVAAPPPGYAAQPVQSAQSWTPALGQQVFNQSAPHVLACVPAPTPISLNLEYGVDGRVQRVGGIEQFPPPTQSCLTNALQYAAVPGGLAQAVVVPFRYR